MTIRISAVVLIQNPQTSESPDFTVTTTRALARTRENSNQEFSLKFFYDKRFVDNNTVNNCYTHNEILQISGTLTEVTNDIIHVTVQQANSFGTITNNDSFDVPSHTIQLNVIGNIDTSPVDRPNSQRTSFDVVATQWVPIFPRPNTVDAPKGRNVEFRFVVHHPIGHSLVNKSKCFRPRQPVNIIGLLEIVDKTLFLQLSDINWISASSGQQSASSASSAATSQTSHWKQDNQDPPRISHTRALAADLASCVTKTRTVPESPNSESQKRKWHESLVQSSLQDNEMEDVKVSSEDSNDYASNNTPHNDRPAKRTRSKGKSIVTSSLTVPKITMVGGMPQNISCPDDSPHKLVSKLRNHATDVLPKRPFSFL
jgi:hypothetical protein